MGIFVYQNEIDKITLGTSLVVQWLGVHLLVQGTQFDPWSGNLDPTNHGATNRVCRNY